MGTTTWQRMTLPLATMEKLIVTALAFLVLVQVALLAWEPSWDGVFYVASNLATVAVFWRWFWLEGWLRKTQSITDFGAAVGECLHRHEAILLEKQAEGYIITPLGQEVRDT